VEARIGDGGRCGVGGVTSECRIEVKIEFACSVSVVRYNLRIA
jgi:hypothetical protein